MKSKHNSTPPDELAQQVLRQLELITKLLAIIATDKDFASHPQEHQAAFLGKMGFRNIEVANLLGMRPQNVTKAFRKHKGKRK